MCVECKEQGDKRKKEWNGETRERKLSRERRWKETKKESGEKSGRGRGRGEGMERREEKRKGKK